ncbi:MAG TPA: hypothetical protein VHJ34_15060 [Actinomycetota bacterium]|nr:hypothetical protein [Actinomycetota bacterium]
MDRDEFYRHFVAFLRDLNTGRDLPEPEPDTHLWAEGYVDSLVLLEIIAHIEDLIGDELALDQDFLPSFFTMRAIYDTHVAPADAETGARRSTGTSAPSDPESDAARSSS